jgi:hypothetical protein
VAVTLALPGAVAEGVPVFTVLTGAETAGAEEFLRDLGTVWKHLHHPIVGLLAANAVDDPERRLRLLERGRGHFAIIDTPLAIRKLAEHPSLVAIGLLWPEYLHVLTADPKLRSLELPLRRKLTVSPSARYVYDALLEWSQDKPNQAGLLALGEAPDPYFALPEDGVWVFSAPAPTEEVAAVLTDNSELRLLSVSPRLVEELRLLFPWLQTERLPRGAYPEVRGKLELPVRHLLMVGRRDLAPPAVQKMLRSLYDRKRAVAPFNPLFATLDEKLNVVFAKLVPYHPVAAKALAFPPQVR